MRKIIKNFRKLMKKADKPKIKVEETAKTYPAFNIEGEDTGDNVSREIWVIENGAARMVDSLETAEREYIRSAFIAGVKGSERPSFSVLVKIKKNKDGVRYDA